MALAGTEVGGVEVAKRVGRLASSAPIVMGEGLVGADFDVSEDDCCVCCLSVRVSCVCVCVHGGWTGGEREREEKRREEKRRETFII